MNNAAAAPIFAGAFLLATAIPAFTQSLAGSAPVGSCPDASPEEAEAMGFRHVPMSMPRFIQRGELAAEGFEARIAAHKLADFAIIDESFRTFAQKAPNMKNKVAPLPDAQLFLHPDEGTQAQGEPIYAFCFSYSPDDWSFMPATEVSNLGTNLSLAGTAPLTIPPQTYAVFEYDGPRADVANFRYTLTSAFWPLSAVKRVESPNFEVYPDGDDGVSENVSLQLWVAVDPATIPTEFQTSSYGSAKK